MARSKKKKLNTASTSGTHGHSNTYSHYSDAAVKNPGTTATPERTCYGLKIAFPPGKNAHTSYPFGLHGTYNLPWGYQSIGDSFYLKATSCRNFARAGNTECTKCNALPTHRILSGILFRIEHGVHENSPLLYFPIQGLVELGRRRSTELQGQRLIKLNDTRKLGVKMRAIEDHKELTMAIASGKMARVGNILEAGLANHAGVRGLAGLCLRAQVGKYHVAPDAAARAVGLLLLRLGGARVAEIGHRALGLPSVTTLRRHTVIRPLLPSAGMPTVAEIEANIDACFDATPEFSAGDSPRIIHEVLTLDEMGTERRPRYDDRTNHVVGVCRQHGHKVPLTLNSEEDIEELCNGLKKGDAHLAREATVAALGALSANPREYSVRPILFSADCKQETGVEHAANILQPLITAIENKSKRGNTIFRLVCAASDGESRRGLAFAKMFMKKELPEDSPIFSQIIGLELMNRRVGDDDRTCDKDYKHAIKCLRSLVMRDSGFEILGYLLTVPIVREHLLADGLSHKKINSYLNPNDKQDVVLSFSLLRAIWSLPEAPVGSTPQFTRAREALRIFGKLAYNIVMPYICLDMDLSTQLVHLSTAAHLLLDLYLYNDARTRFMPNQTFVNLMIMIKNVFFCVAKTKVDIPDGDFWIILLGTDRLEVFFGLIRTAIGTDANVDLLQLASRGTHTTEVQVILSSHPEWDRTPRRIKLPAVTSAGDLDSKVDHINPASCTGNLKVSGVNCLTCWRRGRRIVEEIIPASAERFERLCANPNINILAPKGIPMVNIGEDDEDPCEDDDELSSAYSCSKLEAEFPPVAEQESEDPEPSYLGDGDLEDAIAVEEPRGGFDAYIQINGQRVTKAKALRLRMMDITGPRSSTDRTRRVASVPAFNHATGIIETEGSILGLPCLRIDNPIATLVRCEGQLFLAIGSVNGLTLGSQSLDEINIPALADASAVVSFQIMRLVRATVEDDPTERHDWRWSRDMDGSSLRVPGILVQPLNPTLSTRGDKPTYLFDSSELLVFASTLHEQILPRLQSLRSVPVAPSSSYFPYRSRGEACFLCEGNTNLQDLEVESDSCCLQCGVALDFTKGQRVLEHYAAHQLHDKSINRADERCGLCNRPAPMCTFYLMKGKGTTSGPAIDWERSTCQREIHFHYSIAATSKTESPCSNVPVPCPTCGPKKPAPWKYNLEAHFRNYHKLDDPATWPSRIEISPEEVAALGVIWKNRNVLKRKRRSRKPKALKTSKEHSTRLALRPRASVDEALENLTEPVQSAVPLPDSMAASSEEELDSDGDASFAPLEYSKKISRQSRQTRQRQQINSDLESEPAEEPLHLPLAEPVGNTEGHIASDRSVAVESFNESINEASDPHSERESSEEPESELREPKYLTRNSGKRKERGTAGCDGCGDQVSEQQKQDGEGVECAGEGCETRWFHRLCMGDDDGLMPRGWKCESCLANSKSKKQKWG